MRRGGELRVERGGGFLSPLVLSDRSLVGNSTLEAGTDPTLIW